MEKLVFERASTMAVGQNCDPRRRVAPVANRTIVQSRPEDATRARVVPCVGVNVRVGRPAIELRWKTAVRVLSVGSFPIFWFCERFVRLFSPANAQTRGLRSSLKVRSNRNAKTYVTARLNRRTQICCAVRTSVGDNKCGRTRLRNHARVRRDRCHYRRAPRALDDASTPRVSCPLRPVVRRYGDARLRDPVRFRSNPLRCSFKPLTVSRAAFLSHRVRLSTPHVFRRKNIAMIGK
jgi:hypothetical protein